MTPTRPWRKRSNRVGLAAEAAVPVGALTPGGRKRAAIAAELLPRPAQLFLDEPTASLDPAQATEVLRLLRQLSSGGMTVVLTTSSPLDAARCDKVAVLANGGHLAFFGTPAAARGYFGADSLEEIYERLAGLGDPAAAWSRRFFQFPRTRAGSTSVPTTPRAPGPAVLVPDAAGPHSAGRPGPVFVGGLAGGDGADAEQDETSFATSVPEAGFPDGDGRGRSGGPLRPARQLPVLIRRNAEVLARASRLRTILVSVPVAVLVAFCVLLGAGALDGAAAVTLAWVVLGGLVTGLAYELPLLGTESGVLRRERFAGLSTAVFVLAKAAVLLPVLALADALILVVPAIAGRLQDGFGPAYLTVACASADRARLRPRGPRYRGPAVIAAVDAVRGVRLCGSGRLRLRTLLSWPMRIVPAGRGCGRRRWQGVTPPATAAIVICRCRSFPDPARGDWIKA